MALKLNPYVLPTGSDFLRGSKIAKQNEGIPIFGNGILGNVAGGFGSSFLGGLGDAVNFIGFNNVADVLHSGGDYFEDRLKPAMPAEVSLNYLTSPEGLARGFGNLTGSIASIAAPTALVPGSAFATGANLLSKLPMLGRLGTGTLKMGLRGALTAPMEASMEAGNYIENAIARGEDPEIARQKANEVFGKNAAFLALSNLGQWGLASKILNGTGWKSRLAAAAVEPHIQAIEEGEQQAFQNAAEGKPYSYNPFNWTSPQYASQGQAALEGYLPSALLSGLGFAGSSIFGNRNKNSQNGNPPQPSPIETPANTENPKSQGKGGATIDQFMGAISGQESGGDYNAENERTAAAGKYQILPTNWASWAQDAGLSPDAPMTPKNQEIIAKNKMLEYYNKFGNWRDVAIAWYGGEGAVGYSEEAKNRPQDGGYPSISEYADSVMSRLEKIAGTTEGESQPQRRGNTLKINPQSGKECTLEAMASIYNAYTGENTTASDWDFSGSNWWYDNLKNGKLQAQEYNFSSSERENFEQVVKDHFDKHPNKPIFLYQAGGAGSSGNHSLNRVSGTHATIIGRRLDNGKYQVFDSNGGMTHELELSEIFDPTANGGDSLSGMNVGEGNTLFIPSIDSAKEITNWQTESGEAVGSSRACW